MQKKRSNNKRLLMTITFTTIALVVIALAIYLIINNRECYKVEPRDTNILKYKAENEAYVVDGWIRVQGTNIDYPVIYPDNNLDLTEITDDFVWVLESEEELLDRTVILGHNIRNVSSNPLITNSEHTRFEQLLSFIYYDFAKSNQYIQYTRNGKDYLYQIFSISFIDENELALSGKMGKERFKKYINKAIDDSYFKYDVEVDENDKVITLITCTRFFGDTKYRFKIDGKLLENDEKAKLKKVTIKNNYKKIEDIMRGGKINE